MNKSMIIEDAISELNSILSSAQTQFTSDPKNFTSSIDSVRQWKNEVECPFEIYCDRDRRLYHYFGFPGKAYARVWNVQTLDYYVEQKLNGKKLPTALDKNDDPNQMGGNVIIDQSGRVIWVYKSKSPTDRPSVRQLQCILER
ncbi:unnamed protein product [Rotaria socialis]|uniref:Redoxin domain-containing protein n=1 Tax=Rotaria socialis TaxID=392032 RepID=A0A819WT28_9BILA|nr:unnamed protein product [Rotaria socialis]CAF4147696.1 unnamed protein product [Rotaria socialis]CAF4429405.1 unnamed protein product [Rotaria socialis]CAF4500998.1 unnamed protein product [Rotaria socialis]CAF4509287.1 unnamed protein product [Rotaria socialis]